MYQTYFYRSCRRKVMYGSHDEMVHSILPSKTKGSICLRYKLAYTAFWLYRAVFCLEVRHVYSVCLRLSDGTAKSMKMTEKSSEQETKPSSTQRILTSAVLYIHYFGLVRFLQRISNIFIQTIQSKGFFNFK